MVQQVRRVSDLELRRTQRALEARLLTNFKTVAAAFKHCDIDRSETVKRDEMKYMLQELNMSDISDRVLDALIDYADTDPVGASYRKALSYPESLRVCAHRAAELSGARREIRVVCKVKVVDVKYSRKA